ncbi:glycosyltransferase family 4 protein [Ochrobactrum pseudogrignonense]|nr:glycosyltransferase family 4 protein [Brucella pseudogrignonensis]
MPLSIDIPDYPPSTKPSFHDNIIRIAFVGRFVQSKGIDDLIKSLNNIVSGNIELVLQVDLIGNLKFSDEIVFDRLKANIEKIHSKAKDKILFNIHGNASNDAKHKILAEADIFVLPTYHEDFASQSLKRYQQVVLLFLMTTAMFQKFVVDWEA